MCGSLGCTGARVVQRYHMLALQTATLPCATTAPAPRILQTGNPDHFLSADLLDQIIDPGWYIVGSAFQESREFRQSAMGLPKFVQSLPRIVRVEFNRRRGRDAIEPSEAHTDAKQACQQSDIEPGIMKRCSFGKLWRTTA